MVEDGSFGGDLFFRLNVFLVVLPPLQDRRYIVKVLERTGWVVRKTQRAAAILGKHEATLRNRMRKLGI